MNPWLNRISNLLLLILATLCQVTLIQDSFLLLGDPSLPIWLIAACLLLWLAGSFRRGFWVGMPLSALLLYGAYRYYDTVPADALRDFLERIAGAYYTHVVYPGAAYGYGEYSGSHALILLFLGFLLAAYLITALTAKSARIPLSVLGTLPIFAACIVVNGEPPVLAAIGILLFWALLLVSGGAYRPEGHAWRSFFALLLPICLVLGVVLHFHRPEEYVFSERDALLRDRFDRFGQHFDLFFGNSAQTAYTTDPDHPGEGQGQRSHYQSSWMTDDSRMDLRQAYNHDRDTVRILQVQAETSGKLYLRTQSFGDYTGTGWLPAEELNAGSSLPFTAFAAAASPLGTARELEVRTFVDIDALCLPYYAAVSTGSDVLAQTDGQENYRISYTDYQGAFSELRLPADAVQAELIYRSHAHDTYTRLPASTREAAQKLCREANLRSDSPNLLQEVASYVRESGEYDLNTGAYPSEDYAIYFLTEAHRGYCVHFATAATVLYRALGVPARITEGFLVDTRAGRFSDVTADSAHAWVEVYIDGLGWVPIEVTGRAGVVPNQAESAATATPEPSPEPESMPQDPESTDNGENGADPSPSPSPETASEDSGTTIPPDRPAKAFPWRVILIVLALLLLPPLWYALARLRFRMALSQSDGRKAAVSIWRLANRASRFGCEIPEPITHAAEKAVFSPHLIQRDELVTCRASLQTMLETCYPRLNKLQKIRFRFLHGFR